MKAKISIALILAAAVVAAILAVVYPPSQTGTSEPQQPQTNLSSTLEEASQPEPPKPAVSPRLPAPLETETTLLRASAEAPAGSTNKLERLARTRETFRALAAGDPASALRSAKQIKDGTERETALLTLVTEWTQGDLR